MPYYIYRDKNTELEVEVLRTAVEDSDGNIPYYNVPPTREEAAVLSDEEYDAADWLRVMSKKQKSIGFGMKGYWILLLGLQEVSNVIYSWL